MYISYLKMHISYLEMYIFNKDMKVECGKRKRWMPVEGNCGIRLSMEVVLSQ